MKYRSTLRRIKNQINWRMVKIRELEAEIKQLKKAAHELMIEENPVIEKLKPVKKVSDIKS